MNRYDFYDHLSGEPLIPDIADDGEWVRYEDHEAIIKRQAAAALSGMNAAKAISSHQVDQAYRLNRESSPEALESERSANAILTGENERLREDLASARRAIEQANREQTHWPVNSWLATHPVTE